MTHPHQPKYDKLLAIMSYITPVGWILSYLVYKSDMEHKNSYPLYSFHMKQSLGLFLLFVMIPAVQLFFFFVPFISWIITLISPLLYLGVFVIWLLGLTGAINETNTPVPLIGIYLQRWFKEVS